MYRPAHYDEPDQERLLSLVDQFPFATLVSARPSLWATHLPLLRDDTSNADGVLIGHMAKGNPQWRALSDGDPVLAIFQGPDAYISPQWYTEEADVPTWNYVAVHVNATWHRIDNEGDIDSVLRKSVHRFEQTFAQPWSLNSLDPEIIQQFKADITVFSLRITTIEGVQKMGQDKTARDVSGVVKGLSTSPTPSEEQVAQLMVDANPEK